MPFPVIDRQRYFQYAFGIGSLLVKKFIYSSSSTHITIISSPWMLDTEHSEISSHLLLLLYSDQLMDNINNKF